LASQALILSLQVVDLSPEGLTVGTPNWLHEALYTADRGAAAVVAVGEWVRLSLGR
jgi:hypothetical protein